jgi:hypothetical protein
MDETIRYRPSDAVRWLKIGAETMRDSAKKQGAQVVSRDGIRNLKKDISQAAGALWDMGKSAVADAVHVSALNTEYLLGPDRIEVIRPVGSKIIEYSKIRRIRRNDDVYTVELDQGSFVIAPPAYVTSGAIKAPIGWDRNGHEVEFRLLAEELSARVPCDLLDE